MNKIKELPAPERPYEKCLKYGAQMLSNTELLSVILRTGTVGRSAKDLAADILTNLHNESELLSVMHLKKEQLLKIKGIGNAKACQILCIAELAKRIASEKAAEKLRFDMPSTIAEYYMERLRHLEQEHLYVLYLDTKCNLIKEHCLTTGSVNQSLISSREIFLEAFRCDAVSFVLIHNHPSGDSTPSRADISVSKEILKGGQVVGINLLDHIIIGDRQYYSMREQKVFD